jgi:oxygen-independent coproporphyrinogen-3 oxidase
MTRLPDAELLRRYDQAGPRYTSYPTAPTWDAAFRDAEHRQSLRRAAAEPGAPMAMYVHVPFCRSLCLYCACSVIIARDPARGERYVGQVLREAALAREALAADRPIDRPVVQHHWGGGTPTFLPPDQLERLFAGLVALFPLAPGAEVSIEIDPRVTTVAQLERLRASGFNRVSMGVQDFDPEVQQTIHRVQSFELTRDIVQAARGLGFESVNLDLIYGLPHQRTDHFQHTIDLVLQLRPDRIACYGYAHVPWLKKHQRALPEAALPKGGDKLALYLTALAALQGAGYRPIGMDHFALPDDGLVTGADAGRLHRNFMGYTTQAARDMLSFGVTAISEVAGAFAQNVKTIAEYDEHLDAGRLPVERGLRRSDEDERRRAVILDLMCRFRLDYAQHGGRDEFVRRYANALAALQPLAADGLLAFDDDGIRVTELGRLFVRNVAMPFDGYLERQRAAAAPMFSRTV